MEHMDDSGLLEFRPDESVDIANSRKYPGCGIELERVSRSQA